MLSTEVCVKKLDVKNFYNYWEALAVNYSDRLALKDDYMQEEYTFPQAFEAIKQFSCGLKALGLKKGNHVSIFSENSVRWMITDQALLMNGMVDAVRGSGASVHELEYILEQSDSVALVVENLTMLNKLLSKAESLGIKFIMHLSKEKFEGKSSCPVYSFEEVMKLGKDKKFEPVSTNRQDLATLIYTSGTTGFPKGVMLTQGNILSQIKNIHSTLRAEKPGKALCILPIWHAYERTVEYYLMSCGVTMVYTNLKNFKSDIKKYNPSYFVSVPRIWDSIYEGMQKKISEMPESRQKFIKFLLKNSIDYKNAKRILTNSYKNNFEPDYLQKASALATMAKNAALHTFASRVIYPKFKAGISPNFIMGISGGGALQWHLDEFFDAVGIYVLNGYGLTESSPVIGVRRRDNNTLGSIGKPIDETQIKIIDPESKKEIKNGKKGVLCIKGPQVMRGYYKNPEATSEVIMPEGWLNTGDLVQISPDGSILITGRAKDTIVLLNGENIEPQGIEDACLKSPFIKQIVLVGQDKPSLGALVVPDYENIKAQGQSSVAVEKLIQQEVKKLVSERENFVSFERISSVKIVNEEFTIDNGLMTPTVKIRRNKVFERYSALIEDMFS